MSAKTNIRSFRYSDEVAEILEAQPGDSLNAKFEELVRTCYIAIDERQRQLARINEQIEERQQLLLKLEAATTELSTIERDLRSVEYSFSKIKRRAAALEEGV